jgi:ABC-type transporter lipoprotein component MlaA
VTGPAEQSDLDAALDTVTTCQMAADMARDTTGAAHADYICAREAWEQAREAETDALAALGAARAHADAVRRGDGYTARHGSTR